MRFRDSARICAGNMVPHYTKQDRRFYMNSKRHVLFLEYPKCTTCKKARKWLQEQGVDFEDRDIKEKNPTAEELKIWYQRSGLPLKRFFNTSGLLYKSMQLKDRLLTMSEEEQIALLATDGMLVKRPLLISEDGVLVGFKEAEWEKILPST